MEEIILLEQGRIQHNMISIIDITLTTGIINFPMIVHQFPSVNNAHKLIHVQLTHIEIFVFVRGHSGVRLRVILSVISGMSVQHSLPVVWQTPP